MAGRLPTPPSRLVMETVGGIDSYEGPLPHIRFILIEGSKRMRYLNALHARGEVTGPHQLYILSEGSQSTETDAYHRDHDA